MKRQQRARVVARARVMEAPPMVKAAWLLQKWMDAVKAWLQG